jgi:hypothetical protein
MVFSKLFLPLQPELINTVADETFSSAMNYLSSQPLSGYGFSQKYPGVSGYFRA